MPAKFTKTSIEGVFIIEPQLIKDHRGYFMESFNGRDFKTNIGDIQFVQDNESESFKGVMRGLHFQTVEAAQSKLVRVIEGTVQDVAVDLRKGSPTFGQYESVILSGENKKQFFIPKGFAHGFLVLSERAIFTYKVDNFYSPQHDTGMYFNDPNVDIKWELPIEEMILSEKDKNLPMLEDASTF